MNTLTITIDTSDDAMVGGEGWGQYDASASVSKFLARVEAALTRVYSDYEISVESGLKFNVEMEDDFADAEAHKFGYDDDRIHQIVDQVWEAGEWYVESDDDSEPQDTLKEAFESFMSDTEAVEEAIDNSTSASHGGGSYKLELFHDGTYRVLASNQIGNLYDSAGIIVSIPTLRDDEMAVLDDDDNEVVGAMYDNAIEELRRNFEYAISES